MSKPTHLRVHQFAGFEPGPKLLISAAVHGNEIAGVGAIQKVMAALDSGELTLLRGTVTFIPVVNPLAHQLGRREGDRNLNRNLRPPVVVQDFEDLVARQLCPWLAWADVLLDLHTFQGQGKAFAMMGPRNNSGPLEPFTHEQAEGQLALCVGTDRIVEGWLSTYALGLQRRAERDASIGGGGRTSALQQDPHYGVGTTEYMRSQGGYCITLECGQHADPHAPEVAHKAILRVLTQLGMIAPGAVEPRASEKPELLQLYEVVDREHEGDQFAKTWASFDAVSKGEQIGTRHDGTPVLAIDDGRIVFPAANAKPGSEWFYLARASSRQI